MENPLFKKLPKIGIRPTIDGRPPRRPRIARKHKPWTRPRPRPNSSASKLFLPERQAGGMRHRRHLHRRRGRGGRLRGEIRARRRRVDAHRDAVLVLRQRDNGHGSGHSQGRLGIQRHRTARRGLSGRRAGRPRAKRIAGLRHLRPRCSGRRRQDHSRRRARKRFCDFAAPAWPWP